jgi:hypothetical protein
MSCLDVIGVIVAPRPTHSLWAAALVVTGVVALLM